MVASLTSSCLITGSHCNCLRIGVTSSNFLVPETIWAAKCCTVCNSFTFFLVVLAHTDEQYNNLLKYERINCSDQRTPIKQVFYAIYLTKATYTFRSACHAQTIFPYINVIKKYALIIKADDKLTRKIFFIS